MNLTRKFKLHKLGIKPEPNIKKAFKFLESRFFNLQKFEIGSYPNWRFYMSLDNQNVLQYDTITKIMYVQYADFWTVLENKYKLDHQDIKKFIYNITTENYEMDIAEIRGVRTLESHEIEKQFALKNEFKQSV